MQVIMILFLSCYNKRIIGKIIHKATQKSTICTRDSAFIFRLL
jgi:hypothetical protein